MTKQPASEVAAFAAMPLSSHLLTVLEELGYKNPTPVQEKSLPLLLAGKDLIGQSKTGSGKTLAFALPILNKISMERRHLQALILCPTRELCQQVAGEVRKLGRRLAGFQVLVLSGGQPIGPQLSALEKGVHVGVGTPGRLLDLISRKKLDLRKVFCLVLDEADRMLDMGFQEDMEEILEAVPPKRQTVFFSATYPATIENLSRRYQQNPARVTISSGETTAEEIDQCYVKASEEEKATALVHLLQEHEIESALVFCNFKETTKKLTAALVKDGISAAAIHGDLEQFERDRVIARFRNHSVRVLVATDVAARGIDVEKLDAVFNFQLPPQPEVYVHRIGRTGRASQKGRAIAIVSPREEHKIERIEAYTNKTIRRLNVTAAKTADAPSKSAPAQAKMETIYISGGRKQKMRPGDILGALTGEAGGLKAQDVGKIEIHDNFSYVAVSRDIAKTVLQRLSNGTIKGRKFRVEIVR